MMHFNELRVSSDNQYLIIDVSVDSQDFFQDVLLDSIIIDTQDTYVPNGPSANPIYTYKIKDMYDLTYSIPEECSCNPVREEEDMSYCLTYGTQQMKNVRLLLTQNELKVPLCGNMFFIYVTASGAPSDDTPVELTTNPIMGTVVNMNTLYKTSLCYIKEVSRDCSIPKKFIDFILRVKAVELCIKTGNYTQAIKYWKKFFAPLCDTPTTNCGCNGGTY